MIGFRVVFIGHLLYTVSTYIVAAEGAYDVTVELVRNGNEGYCDA